MGPVEGSSQATAAKDPAGGEFCLGRTMATIHSLCPLLPVIDLGVEKPDDSQKILPPGGPYGQVHHPVHVAEMVRQTVEQNKEGPSAYTPAGECVDQADPQGERPT